MIVIGNPEFAIGMKLAGIKDSFSVRNREQGLSIIKNMDKNELVMANVSIVKMLPELNEFRNIVTIPDNVEELKSTKDLNSIIKSAVGIELNI